MRLLFVSLGLFVISLFPPALFLHSTNDLVTGYWLLPFGWMAFEQYNFAWLANAVFSLGFLLSMAEKHLHALVSSFVASALALQMFFVEQVPVAGSSGGWTTFTLYPGYYLWLAAILLLVFHTYSEYRLSVRARPVSIKTLQK